MVPRLHRLALALVVVFVAAPVDSASAQGCAPLTISCDTQKPIITISPTTGRTFQNNTVQVTITWSDDMYLNGSTRWIKHNGVPVTTAFSYVEDGSSATSTDTITLASGSSTIEAYICDMKPLCEKATAVYTYTPPPAPIVYGTPQISFVAHNPTSWIPSPFDGTASFTTPAFISRDMPHAAQLVYYSSRARPKGFVQLDVTDHSITPIARFELLVKNESNVLQTLINNDTIVSYNGVNGTNRLAAQWDADTDSTGAYKYTIIVRTVFTDSTRRETSDTTRVLIVNDRFSYFGAGWSVAGLQRVRGDTHGAVVTNGDGSAVYFRKNGSTYITPPGEFSTLTRDGAQNYIRSYPDSTKAVFNAAGALLHVMDRFGRKTTYAYTSARLSSIRFSISAADSLTGPAITFGYTSNRLSSITDPGGRTTSFTMDSGNLTKITGPDNVIAFTGTYDSDRQLRTRKDRRSKTWGYAYDFAGKLSADTMPVVSIDTAAVRPVVRYSAWESAALVDSSKGVRPRVDPVTVRARITDPNNAITRFRLDPFYGPTLIEAPLGHTTQIHRDWNGLPRRIVPSTGAPSSYSWNNNGTLYSYQQSSSDKLVVFTYDSVWTTEPRKVAIGWAEKYYTYGPHGELLHEILGADTVDYEYDADYRLTKVTDPQGHSTTYTYHSTGTRNLASVVVNGLTTSYAYDAYGRTSSVTTPTGTSSVAYDIMNRDTSRTDPTGRTTRYSYDGDLVSKVTDAAGKQYQFRYNALGWLEADRNPAGDSLVYRYDKAGRAVGFSNRRGDPVSFTLDSIGRVLTRTAGADITTFAYGSPDSTWVAASNSESTDTIHYDGRGRVTREITRFGSQRYEILSKYHSTGPRDSVTINGPGGSTRFVRYNYNEALQLDSLIQLVDGVRKATSIQYNKDGLPWKIRLPTSGVNENTLTYTSDHQLDRSDWNRTVVSNAFGSQYSYAFDGRLASVTNTAMTAGRKFGFNARNELLGYLDEEYITEWMCPIPDEPETCYPRNIIEFGDSVSYSYDAIGNRTDSGASLYSGTNRYQSFGGYSFEYDKDGNLTRKYKSGFNQVYTWNRLGQLTSVTTNGTTVNYRYNGFGERVYRAVGSTGNRYVYDGDDLALEVDLAGNKVREYTYYPGIDAPHSLTTHSGAWSYSYYYVTEPPGHVIGLMGSGGIIETRYRYSPWGVTQQDSGFVENPLRYMSRELDSQTGLYYVRNRWYDPDMARFISEDPIGLAGGINLYSYAANNPIDMVDPTGLAPRCVRGRWNSRMENGAMIVDWKCLEWEWDVTPPLPPLPPRGPNWGDGSGPGPIQLPDGGAGWGSGNYAPTPPKVEQDPCQAYSSGGVATIVGWICRRVHGPNSNAQNTCTANCLAEQWREEVMSDGRAGLAETWDYLWNDHVACYSSCGYSKREFGRDFATGAGSLGRFAYPVAVLMPRDATAVTVFR